MAEALINAVITSKQSDEYEYHYLTENAEEWNVQCENGVQIDYSSEEGGVPGETMEKFIDDFLCSILAVFPTVTGEANFFAEYDGGGVEEGRAKLVNREVSSFQISDDDGELYAELFIESDDVDMDSLDDEEIEISRYNYPNYKLNWTAEGMYELILAALDDEKLDNIYEAFKNGLIERKLIEETRDYSCEISNEEVTAAMIEWLKIVE